MVGMFAFVVGAYGEHGASGPDLPVVVMFFGSWVVLLLELIALGVLVAVNAVLSLVRVRDRELVVDVERLRTYHCGYQVGYVTKLCCGVVVVVFVTASALLSGGILVVDSQLLSVPDLFVTVGQIGTSVAMVTVPVCGSILILCVFVHAVGRALRIASGAVYSSH